MTSSVPMRDPVADHLLTPLNSVLVIVDYQPVQVSSVASRPKAELVDNIKAVARTAALFQLPVILSTINVTDGKNAPTIHQIRELLPDAPTFDRTSINAWEDEDFVRAVKATGRKKLIVAALWTEACLEFLVLDALHSGFDVYPVVDAVGGTSLEAHILGLQRMTLAGARPSTWVQLICELQRDWNRVSTAKEFAEILFGVVGL